MRVVLYTVARECPLCEDAFHLLRTLSRDPEVGALEVEVRPIDADPRLVVRHALRVPVIEVDGRELAHGKVDRAALVPALKAARVQGERDRASVPTSP